MFKDMTEELKQAVNKYVDEEWLQQHHNVDDTFLAGARWAYAHPSTQMALELYDLVDGYMSGVYEGMTLKEVIDTYY